MTYHLECGINSYLGEPPIAKIFNTGGLGVPLFFVLSGFVIAMAADQRPRSPRNFLIGRLARLYPVYLVTAGLFVLALALVPSGALNHSPGISGERLLRTLVFDFGRMGGYVYVAWTLFYELCFYLLFAPFAERFARLRRMAWFQSALLASLLLCAGMELVHVGCFLLGMVLFLLFTEESEQRRVVFAVCLMAFGFRSPEVLACAAFVAILILLECRWKVNFNATSILRLGNASYSIYLIQVLTISASLKLAQSISGPNNNHFALIALVLGLISTVLAGLAMHRWIEKPGTILSLRAGERLLSGAAGNKG